MSKEAIIKLDDVVKTYKRGEEEVRAINGITMKISKGDFLAISGPSGSGKTTLMNIIGCVDNPTSGRVMIKNRDVTYSVQKDLTDIRRHSIGFVFQQFFLISTLTASENIQVPGIFAGNKEREQRAEELLDMVELSHRKDHLPSQLSGGEMQRVAIARALINSPDILLADEPTGNLDSKNSENIYNIFNKMNKNSLTVIVVTHNLELAKYSNKVILLKDGKTISY